MIKQMLVLVGGLSGAMVPGLADAAWETANVGGLDTRVYTPASMSPAGEGRALMVILHGCSQTAEQIKTYGNLEAAADSMGVVMAVPNVPNGGVVAGCWDYYGTLQSRTTKHTGPVVAMTEALRDDPTYAIDPNQMYMVGFSSGGGQALIIGCAAPDLFAGVGAVAAPGLGSTIGQIGSPGTTGAATATLCEQLAGSHAADLETQTAIVFNDANDFTVAQGYGQINTEMFATLIAGGLASMTAETFDMATLPGAGPTGMGTTYADDMGERIVRLQSSGVSHNWPAGSGAAAGGLTFISGQGLNFSQYAAEFFAANNVRAGGWVPGGDDGTDSGTGDGTSGAPGDTGDDAAASDSDAGNGGGSDSGGAAGSSGGGDDGTGGAASGGASGAAPGEPGYVEPSGCQCASHPAPMPLGWLVVLVGGLSARRRRLRSAHSG